MSPHGRFPSGIRRAAMPLVAAFDPAAARATARAATLAALAAVRAAVLSVALSVALIIALAAVAHADSRALVRVPLPPDAASRLVANDVVQNGHRISIATLEPRGTLEQTLAFYRDAWPARGDDPGHLETRVGDWVVLSRLADEANLVVQLRDGGSGPDGFVSAMSLAPAGAGALAPPPMPAGGELLSTTATRDASLAARTSVVSSTARAGELAAFYRDALGRDGWRLVSDRALGGPRALLFDGRGARLELVVADVDGGSVAVINEVRGDD